MSRASEAKKARRRKRRTVRDQTWLPAGVLDELEIASQLEEFDARLTERGWVFGEEADEGSGVFWVWPDSAGDVDHDAERADATVILLSPDDGGETAHVVFVGTAADYQFNLDELFEHIDMIEAFRLGDPAPVFD
ncbi:hypothetical protein [Mycolicibacterium gilvum]|uniref:Uncharacterized protein n=1 Tax=Mycolicibacterium gilvum TaxID=1804 RepID=A0A378SF60_9MYCO|nr:hypothetical protein [Mycolicibacterium gilvum]MCV7054165.1 hypothetical protein [Mycolicibacterium gilvum]STZ41373.1 Uncharacterised protein [Mycolicibacterium gilvum]